MGIDTRSDVVGALLVDKPSGPTSHDVVAFVRRTLKTSRVGHTGTLDPLATGLLVVLVGSATRLAQFVAADEKEYVADVRLGVATPTYDAASLADGVRSPMPDSRYPTTDSRHPMRAELEAVLAKFRGSFLQTPPQFSAKKVAGVAAYEKARRNETVDLKPVPVTVRELQVLDTSNIGYRLSDIDTSTIEHRPSPIDPSGLLRLRVVATAGFYVRSLAHDIGQALGCGAHLEALRRTRVGRFRVETAVTLDELTGAVPLMPPGELLGEMPSATLTDAGVVRASHGNPLRADHIRNGDGPNFSQNTVTVAVFWQLLDGNGTLLAVAERRPDGLLHPLVVLR